MRKRTRLALLAGVVLLPGVGVFVMWHRPDRITQETYDRLKLGMSGRDVEALLGPPGDYRSGPTVAVSPPKLFDIDPLDGHRVLSNAFEFEFILPSSWTYTWEGDSVKIRIVMYQRPRLDQWDTTPPWSDGVLGNIQAARCESMTFQLSPLDNLLWRIKRQWRKWFPE
jgi:hypothetical protein